MFAAIVTKVFFEEKKHLTHSGRWQHLPGIQQKTNLLRLHPTVLSCAIDRNLRCESCKCPVVSNHVCAYGHHFHQQCLKCSSCGVVLSLILSILIFQGLHGQERIYTKNKGPCCPSCVQVSSWGSLLTLQGRVHAPLEHAAVGGAGVARERHGRGPPSIRGNRIARISLPF